MKANDDPIHAKLNKKNFMHHLLRKLCYALFSLFTIATLTFFLMRVIPGDPFEEEQTIRQDMKEALNQHYGLDQPWIIQYKNYLKMLLKGDLGLSFKYPDRSVNEIIRESFSVSAVLGLEALFWAISGGVFLGIWAAIKEEGWQDHLVMLLTTVGISIPSFILAALLQYVFAIHFDLLPVARWGTFAQSILPSLALAALPMAFICRLIRVSLREVLNSDYIKTAKAKGLTTIRIIYKHALKNALLPVFSYLGQLVANILVGSFVIEKIFSIPGLGQWFVNGVSHRDYPVIMGLTIFYSFILLTTIFLTDLSYHFLDPRIKTKSG